MVRTHSHNFYVGFLSDDSDAARWRISGLLSSRIGMYEWHETGTMDEAQQ